MKLDGTSATHTHTGSQVVIHRTAISAIQIKRITAAAVRNTGRTLALLALILFAGAAHAAKDPIYTSLFNNKAASGYDVVSYFTEAAPVEGNENYKTTYKDADWYFASQANLDMFLANPEKYAPQYGGYCAYAAALGSTAKGDPLLYHIHEDKLFLNINKDIKQKWLGEKINYIEKADKAWPDLLN